MSTNQPFFELVDAIDRLSIEEQSTLLEILRQRLAEHERKRVVADVKESRRDFESASYRSTSVADLMREISQ